ncbi:MAG: DUF2937 family protein [Pseudomonadota bacterium]
MGRFFAVIFAIAAGLAGSQAPAFTLQYMQNLTGRVDELRSTVEEFDASVGQYGYTRSRAMEECGNADGLLEALCSRYAAIVTRFEFLSTHLDALTSATDLERPIVLARQYEQEIVDSALSAYEPAVPATLDGAVYGGGSFVGVWGIASLVFGGLGSIFGGGRRRDRDAYGY